MTLRNLLLAVLVLVSSATPVLAKPIQIRCQIIDLSEEFKKVAWTDFSIDADKGTMIVVDHMHTDDKPDQFKLIQSTSDMFVGVHENGPGKGVTMYKIDRIQATAEGSTHVNGKSMGVGMLQSCKPRVAAF